MKRPIQIVWALAASLLLLAAARAADTAEEAGAEKTLKQSEVPAPVLDAVKKKYPKARLTSFGEEQEEGKKIFEVELTSGKDEISIDLSPEGKILAEETRISPATLPAPIKAGLQASRFKGWKISKAEKVIHDEKEETLAYEVVVHSRNEKKPEKFEVVLDRAGKITKEEAKKATDND
jgi:hypothetical protein